MNKPDETNIETQAEASQDKNKNCSENHHRCHGRRCGGTGKFFVGALALFGLISLGGMLFGSGCGYAGAHHWKDVSVAERMSHMSERLMHKVDATDEQEAQIKAIVTKYEPQFTAMKSEHKTFREAFLTALKQDIVNDAELEQIRKNMLDSANDKSVVITSMISEVASVLTVEQRQELTDNWQNRRHHW